MNVRKLLAKPARAVLKVVDHPAFLGAGGSGLIYSGAMGLASGGSLLPVLGILSGGRLLGRAARKILGQETAEQTANRALRAVQDMKNTNDKLMYRVLPGVGLAGLGGGYLLSKYKSDTNNYS